MPTLPYSIDKSGQQKTCLDLPTLQSSGEPKPLTRFFEPTLIKNYFENSWMQELEEIEDMIFGIDFTVEQLKIKQKKGRSKKGAHYRRCKI